MNVKFEWDDKGHRGGIDYDIDVMIQHRTLRDYTKWAKLFAEYGTKEQQQLVLELIRAYFQKEYANLNVHLANKDEKQAKRTKKIMQMYERKFEILQKLAGCEME